MTQQETLAWLAEHINDPNKRHDWKRNFDDFRHTIGTDQEAVRLICAEYHRVRTP